MALLAAVTTFPSLGLSPPSADSPLAVSHIFLLTGMTSLMFMFGFGLRLDLTMQPEMSLLPQPPYCRDHSTWCCTRCDRSLLLEVTS